MLSEYLPVLLQILVAILFATSALVVSVLVGKTGKRTPAKDMPYECGMIPQGERQPRFSVMVGYAYAVKKGALDFKR